MVTKKLTNKQDIKNGNPQPYWIMKGYGLPFYISQIIFKTSCLFMGDKA